MTGRYLEEAVLKGRLFLCLEPWQVFLSKTMLTSRYGESTWVAQISLGAGEPVAHTVETHADHRRLAALALRSRRPVGAGRRDGCRCAVLHCLMPSSQERVSHLGQWERMMPALESAWKEMEASNGPRDVTQLTARAFDEAQPGGEHAYIGAHANLTVAHEHLDALIALLASHGASPRVPFNLLRPIMETSFKALWVLEPAEGLVRRQRGLRLEVLDYLERRKWLREYEKAPSISRQIGEVIADSRAKTEPKYRREAEVLSMTWDQVQRDLNIIDGLRDLDVVQTMKPWGPPHFRAAWRTLSGFQHGYSYALLSNSTINAQVPIPGGSLVEVTVSDEALDMQGMLCLYLMWEACRLYARRSTRRWSAGISSDFRLE